MKRCHLSSSGLLVLVLTACLGACRCSSDGDGPNSLPEAGETTGLDTTVLESTTYNELPDIGPGDDLATQDTGFVEFCETGSEDAGDAVEWQQISPTHAVITDFEQEQGCCAKWFYTRIGSDRGPMGGGACAQDENPCATLCCDQATVDVPADWAGVWNVLLHTAPEKDVLDLTAVLGPLVLSSWQVAVLAVEMEILEGDGQLQVEWKNAEGDLLQTASTEFSGPTSLSFPVTATAPVHLLNWLLTAPGEIVMSEVRLALAGPKLPLPEALFLWSYAHLYQTFDPATGQVRDRARWPATDLTAVPAMGTFALATALGAELGYLNETQAMAVVAQVRDELLAIPRHESGLLPHFLTGDDITPCTEYSSVDTVIAGTAMLLACDLAGVNGEPVRQMLTAVDWALLTDNFSAACSHGFVDDHCDGVWKLSPYRWQHFGSEAFLVCVVQAAATGQLCKLEDIDSSQPLTDDGSGFNDLMLGLFLPLPEEDVWGVDWPRHVSDSTCLQLSHAYGEAFADQGLFGLSASEVPEPCCSAEAYGAWGTGGITTGPNDGSSTCGNVVVAPHYAAMALADMPAQAQQVWRWLMVDEALFTPLNNVESFTIRNDGEVRWNSLKGSWNLSLQTLGAARAVCAMRNLPYPLYELAAADEWLEAGYQLLVK